MLRALGAAAPAEVAAGLGAVAPGLLAALGDRSAAAAALKVEALAFLQPLLRAAAAAAAAAAGGASGGGAAAAGGGAEEALAPHLPKLGAALFACAGERYYKVSAEALRAAEALVGALRPGAAAGAEPVEGGDDLVAPLLDAVAARLAAQVRRCLCMGAGCTVCDAFAACCLWLGPTLLSTLELVLNHLSPQTQIQTH